MFPSIKPYLLIDPDLGQVVITGKHPVNTKVIDCLLPLGGIVMAHTSDKERLGKGGGLFDALYAWCRLNVLESGAWDLRFIGITDVFDDMEVEPHGQETLASCGGG